MASIAKSNHNINFIPSNIKALVFVCYIINYATKKDYSQYQHMMGATFVWNAHNKAMQQHNDWDQIDCPKIIKINKFTLYAFNHLAYNCKISGLLAANILLDFLKYYIFKKTLKRVNMRVLELYFPKIIFQDAKDKEVVESFIPFGISIMIPTFIFDNYYYWEKELELYFFYDYMKIISCMKYSTR